jgi:hypothetical protein
MPGTARTTSCALDRPRDSRSGPEMAVMLNGVFCTVDSRFSAVTTISASVSLASEVDGEVSGVGVGAATPNIGVKIATDAQSRRPASLPPILVFAR